LNKSKKNLEQIFRENHARWKRVCFGKEIKTGGFFGSLLGYSSFLGGCSCGRLWMIVWVFPESRRAFSYGFCSNLEVPF